MTGGMKLLLAVFIGLSLLVGIAVLSERSSVVTTQSYCLASLQPLSASIAIPLIIGHRGESLEGIHFGTASLGLEYLAETAIPDLLIEELREREEVYFMYTHPTLYEGSLLDSFYSENFEGDVYVQSDEEFYEVAPSLTLSEEEIPLEDILVLEELDTFSDLSESVENTVLLPNLSQVSASYPDLHLSIVGKVLESNDGYGVVTISAKRNRVVHSVIYDAGTEENFVCTGFGSVEAASRSGCPLLETEGGFFSIYSGIDENNPLQRHTQFTDPPFILNLSSCREDAEVERTLEEGFPITFFSGFPFEALRGLPPSTRTFITFPENTEAIAVFHGREVSFHPRAIGALLLSAAESGDLSELRAVLQGVDPSITPQLLLSSDSDTVLRNQGARELLTVYFLERHETGYSLYHSEQPASLLSHDPFGSIRAREVVFGTTTDVEYRSASAEYLLPSRFIVYRK